MTAPQAAPAFRHPDALCVGVDPELFFPARNAAGNADTRRAKTVCFGCPARDACLEHAVIWREPGVWGGTSERQRREIRRQWIADGRLRVENNGNRKPRAWLTEVGA